MLKLHRIFYGRNVLYNFGTARAYGCLSTSFSPLERDMRRRGAVSLSGFKCVCHRAGSGEKLELLLECKSIPAYSFMRHLRFERLDTFKTVYQRSISWYATEVPFRWLSRNLHFKIRTYRHEIMQYIALGGWPEFKSNGQPEWLFLMLIQGRIRTK